VVTKDGRKRLVSRDEVNDEILGLLRDAREMAVGRGKEGWVAERDVETFVTKLYKGKVSGPTARRYVELWFDDPGPLAKVARSQNEHGRTVRVARIVL